MVASAPEPPGGLELLRAGGGGDDPSAEGPGHVDGGQSDAPPPAPEDQHPLTGDQGGATGQGEEHGAVALDERGRLGVVPTVEGMGTSESAGTAHLFGESAEPGEGDYLVAHLACPTPRLPLRSHRRRSRSPGRKGVAGLIW